MNHIFFFNFFQGIGNAASTVNVGGRITGMGGMRGSMVTGLTLLAGRITGMGRMSGGQSSIATLAGRVTGMGSFQPQQVGSATLAGRITGMGRMSGSFLQNAFLLAGRITGMGWLFGQLLESFATQPCTVTTFPGMWTHWQIDTLVRFVSGFNTVASGTFIDPLTVLLYVTDPTGAETTYNIAGGVVKDSIGNYHVDIILNKSGRWTYKWQGIGIANVTANDVIIVVDQSEEIPG